MIEHDRDEGNDLKAMKPQGFDGIGSRHIFYGKRENSNLFECRTARADEIATEIVRAGIPIKPTRVDYAVTFRQTERPQAATTRLRESVRATYAKSGTPAPTKTKSFEGADGADSFYIHTSDNSCLFRSYNKALESVGQYPLDAWRDEVQFRHVRARRAFEMTRAAVNTSWSARSFVAGFLLPYNIRQEWMADDRPCPPPSRIERSDTAKRLEWFINTAVPVAAKLADAGIRPEALLDALRHAMGCTGTSAAKRLLKRSGPDVGS
jgi:hypothetical protein